MMMRFFIPFVGLLVFFPLSFLFAQKPVGTTSLDSLKKIELVNHSSAKDTTSTTDTTIVTIPSSNDFVDVVEYAASDSIKYDFKNQIITLYNKAEITYTNINLKAYQIKIDWNTNELTALGKEDSTGNLSETPIFKQGDDEYKSKTMRYNFVTQRAVVKDIVKKEGEGYLLLERGKRDADGNLNGLEGSYTTCQNTDHPHFRIRSKKLKVVEKRQIVSGPFQLEIMDIPTPIGFPFGLLPVPKKRTSGIIIPSYGETQKRGFFLRDGGYYWAVNEYVDLTFMGEVYSKGVYGLSARSRYAKRYYYTGNFDFRFNSINPAERSASESNQNDFKLTWSHNPRSRGTSSFSANVNLMTSTFNQRNSFNPNDYTQASANSGINYNKTFTGTPFVFAASIRHEQNFQTNIVNITPQANLSMNRIFPFRKLVKNSQSPLAQLGVQYKIDGRAKFSNLINNQSTTSFKSPEGKTFPDTLAFNLNTANDILKNGKWGAQQTATASTSITLLRYFKMNPNASFKQTFYGKRESYEWLRGDTVRTIIDKGLYQFYSYNFGIDLNTTFYSTFLFKSATFKALRHTMIPSIALNYQPDFSDPRYGFYQRVQNNNNGNTTLVPRLNGDFGNPSQGESGTVSIALRNTLEAKVTTKEGKEEKRKLLDSFDFSTSYNLAADSFNLSNISVNLRTSLFNNKIGVNARAGINPYQYKILQRDTSGRVTAQRRIERFAWQDKASLGRFEQLGLSLNTSFSSDGFKPKTPLVSDQAISDADLQYINQNYDLYVDFNVPWSVSINYNWNFTRQGYLEGTTNQNLSLSGDVSVTKRWKVSYNASYDFEQNQFSDASFNIHRDLHCWELRVSWIPVGFRRGYTLDLRVKSSLLQDLKLNRRNNWRDRR